MSADELFQTERTLIFITQRQVFAEVCCHLSQEAELSKKNPFRSLHPFIDDQKLLRIGGRLRHADLLYEKKHQTYSACELYIHHFACSVFAQKFFHAQKSFLLSHLRSKLLFYGNLTHTVKKCIRFCIVCLCYNTNQTHQLMADLHAERVTVSRLLSRVDIDFAWPFITKCVGHRANIRFKSYFAVFVYLAIREVHLEVASQLTTDHFLLCLNRFISRRSRPHLIWSDNSTNFIGSASYIDLSEKAVTDYLANQGVSWMFNPPRPPH